MTMPERSSTDEWVDGVADEDGETDEAGTGCGWSLCVGTLVVFDAPLCGHCVCGPCVEDWPWFSEAFTGLSVVDVVPWGGEDREAGTIVGRGVLSRFVFTSGLYRRTLTL